MSPTPNSFPEKLAHLPCHSPTWSRLVIAYLSSSHGAVMSSRVGTKPPRLFCCPGVSSCLAGSRCSPPLSVASQATWNLMAVLFHFDDNCFSELWSSSSRWPHCWSAPCACFRGWCWNRGWEFLTSKSGGGCWLSLGPQLGLLADAPVMWPAFL